MSHSRLALLESASDDEILRTDYEARTQGAFVEKKVSSVTFHYRNADPVFGLFQAKECQAMLESMQESLPIDVLVVSLGFASRSLSISSR